MNRLLIKQPLNKNVSKEECIEDLVCLFQNIKEAYGMYDYFGAEKFETAYENIIRQLNNEPKFEFQKTIQILKNELDFIRDGHFSIGEREEHTSEYEYAIRYSFYKGIPFIDCKKFYFDNESEKHQLEEFAKKGPEYKNDEPLILDFRGNKGGSTDYIYYFLLGLLDVEDIGYSLKCVQRCSELFLDYLKQENCEWNPQENDSIFEEYIPPISNKKKIYVLIDEHTASAAEEGIAFLKNIENVTIVGEHSAGCGSCGNCIEFYLPNSHLKVYFGTGLVLYDGTINIDAEGGFKGNISYEDFETLFKYDRGL